MPTGQYAEIGGRTKSFPVGVNHYAIRPIIYIIYQNICISCVSGCRSLCLGWEWEFDCGDSRFSEAKLSRPGLVWDPLCSPRRGRDHWPLHHTSTRLPLIGSPIDFLAVSAARHLPQRWQLNSVNCVAIHAEVDFIYLSMGSIRQSNGSSL